MLDYVIMCERPVIPVLVHIRALPLQELLKCLTEVTELLDCDAMYQNYQIVVVLVGGLSKNH